MNKGFIKTKISKLQSHLCLQSIGLLDLASFRIDAFSCVPFDTHCAEPTL